MTKYPYEQMDFQFTVNGSFDDCDEDWALAGVVDTS